MKLIQLLVILTLAGCTQVNSTKNEIQGKWESEDGTYLILDESGKLYGYNIPHTLFPQLKGIRSERFNFSGDWEIIDNELWLHLDRSSTLKLSFGCPLYIKRKGIFENKEIDYLFLLVNTESEKSYKFMRIL